ncbi:hypothetical protein [Niveispirillum fermenti]|uniref:hypothetical protein n=1 Tax=Niveispirillum fermenti TaxID=1233113 RepID=UPI003A898D7D
MTEPTIPARPDAADVAQTLDSLLELLARGEEALAKGEMVDLAGLEREVKPILEAATSLPPPDARSLLDRLEAVSGALDKVAATLERVHGDKLGGRETHATRIRAAQAYRTPKDY